jgi:arylsulfatase
MPRPVNVLWIMTDEQRTDSLGCYGSSWAQTPVLDRLAGEGVQFTAAVTPAPVCVPARTSLLSGRYPHETGVWSNRSGLPEPILPLTWVFEAEGYRTASFGKQHYLTGSLPAFQTQLQLVLSDEVHYSGYHDRWDQRDFDVVQYPLEPHPTILAGRFPTGPEATTEARAVAAAKAWLDDAQTDEPFFLRLSFNGPHTPVVPPAPFDTCVDPADITLPGPPDELPPGAPRWLHDKAKEARASRLSENEVRRMRQAYYGEVAFLDQLVGDLLAWMDGRGLLDNLVLVFCSDHGTHLGDFGLVQKQTFFDPVVNVPYFFWAPGIVQQREAVQTPVEARTLLPTLLDLAGLEVPAGCADSLVPILTSGADPVNEPVYSEFTPRTSDDRLVMVRDGSWKLSACLNPEPSELMLANLDHDPAERVNRINDPDTRPIRERLLKLAIDHIDGHQNSPTPTLRRNQEVRLRQ